LEGSIDVLMETDGLAGCPCLNTSELALRIANTSVAIWRASTYSAFSPNATFPEGYGLRCNTHDIVTPLCAPIPCADNMPCVEAHCIQPWCWVDDVSCEGERNRSDFFPSLSLYYSYQTCGGTNVFTRQYRQSQAPTFPPSLPPSVPPVPPLVANDDTILGMWVYILMIVSIVLVLWLFCLCGLGYRRRRRLQELASREQRRNAAHRSSNPTTSHVGPEPVVSSPRVDSLRRLT